MDEKMINKPTTIVRQEFIDNLKKLINNSELPAFVIEPVLRDFLEEVKMVVKKQYEIDKSYYEKIISEKDKDNNGE